jgi:hypothetical protein
MRFSEQLTCSGSNWQNSDNDLLTQKSQATRIQMHITENMHDPILSQGSKIILRPSWASQALHSHQ